VTNNNHHYNHKKWAAKRRFLRFLIKWIGFTLIAKLERVDGLENVPAEGGGILLINHIAFIDPIVVLHSLPRQIVPLAKVEAYDYPFVGIFPKMWGVVPIKRDAVDRSALQKAMAILRSGEIILVAPEGTRSPALQAAREGVAYLASRTNSPIIPVALEGTPGFPAFRTSDRWKEPGALVHFGRPFRYRAEFQKARGHRLSQMTAEAMYILASLLPEHRRGVYADLSKASQNTIEWL
jgi:1-acyl-sn-glycerol-3-phosphate acyltransferase